MKYLLFIIALLCLPFVTAYDVGDNVSILAEYRINGVLTDADASISIKFPSGEFDISVYNETMTDVSLGRFRSYYTCNLTGTHTAIVLFKNSTSDVVGSDTSTFECGNTNGFNLGTCPTSTVGMWGLWIFFAFVCILGIAGIATRYAVLTGIAGGMFVLLAFTFWSCSDLMGYLCSFLAFAFGMIAFQQK